MSVGKRSDGESSQEKVCERRFAREDPREKVYLRRVMGEGLLKKWDVAGKVGYRKRGPVGKVAGKVIVIPCEEKNNNSLIFID